MKTKQAREEFDAFLKAMGSPATLDAPAAGFNAMLGFYRSIRAEDVDLARDGDMLLFQWGIYGSEENRSFDLDLTRQLICGEGEDDDIWQLHLTYRFPVDEVFRGLGSGDRRCENPSVVDAFQTYILDNAAFQAAAVRGDGVVQLNYECVG